MKEIKFEDAKQIIKSAIYELFPLGETVFVVDSTPDESIRAYLLRELNYRVYEEMATAVTFALEINEGLWSNNKEKCEGLGINPKKYHCQVKYPIPFIREEDLTFEVSEIKKNEKS